MGSDSIDCNSNRLSAIATTVIQWDANGNTLNDGSHGYSYNAFNRLTGVDGSVSYQYNGLGQRKIFVIFGVRVKTLRCIRLV
jgi:hypothetical protein